MSAEGLEQTALRNILYEILQCVGAHDRVFCTAISNAHISKSLSSFLSYDLQADGAPEYRPDEALWFN